MENKTGVENYIDSPTVRLQDNRKREKQFFINKFSKRKGKRKKIGNITDKSNQNNNIVAHFTSIGPKFSLKDTKGKTNQLKDKLFFMKNSSK